MCWSGSRECRELPGVVDLFREDPRSSTVMWPPLQPGLGPPVSHRVRPRPSAKPQAARSRGGKMSDPESSQWQIALTVMENARDVQRRAESDSLRYVTLVAAFLAIRESATSSLSILGLQISDTTLIQFALVPAAAFFAIRYAKAQVLTASLAQFLASHLDKMPGASLMICPPDWDIVRDITHRFGWVRRLLPGGLGGRCSLTGYRRSAC